MISKSKRECRGLSNISCYVLAMKLTVLFLIVAVLQVNANGYGQRLTINENNISITRLLKIIEQQSSYHFLYDNLQLKDMRITRVSVNRASVESTLNESFKGLPLNYKIVKKTIIVKKQKEVIPVRERSVTTIPAASAEIVVSGRVVNAQGEPIENASIAIKGTQTGVTSDIHGMFSITVTDEKDILIISHVNYERKEVIVGDQKEIEVVLIAKQASMDDIVVVAYGQQKKISVTGAISSIGTKEIKQSPSSNLAVGLAGKLPGLISIQRSGEAGNNLNELYIRGVSTPNSKSPLILVDGIERELNFIDPNEVENITILKDASSTALYGVRGANGVILVTTRRGSKEDPEINFTTEISGQQFTRLSQTVNSYEYALLRNLALTNDGLAPEFTAEEIEKYRSGSDPVRYPNTNWKEILLKDLALQQRYNLNVSGGTDKVKYFVNAGYLQQGGQFKIEKDLPYDPDMKLDRYNFRSNIDIKLNKSLSAFLNLAGYLEKQNTPAGVYSTISAYNITSDPPSKYIIALLHDLPANLPGPLVPDGYGDASGEVTSTSTNQWPVWGQVNRSGFMRQDRTNITATYGMEQKLDFFTKGLSAKAVMSFDTRASNVVAEVKSFPVYYQVIDHNIKGADGVDSVYYRAQDSRTNTPLGNFNFENYTSKTEFNVYLNYGRTFNDHNITSLLLFQRRKEIIDNQLPYNHIGFAYRLGYGYSNKYFLEFNAGYNGSEQFAKGHRFGFFPAGSASWVLSNEPFLKNNPVLTLLKLRASYGIVGNDGLGGRRFLYLDDIQVGAGGYSSSLASVAGIPQRVNVNLLGNTELQWETAKKTNIGVEFQLFDALNFTVDVFNEKRDNILITPNSIPDVIGLSSGKLPPLNLGIIKNHGYEIQLDYNKRFNNDFSILSKLNFNYAKNKVIFADESLLPEDYAYRYRATGFPLGQQWGYIVEGYFMSEEEILNSPSQNLGASPKPGDFKYKDLNGDNVVDGKDIAPIGYPTIPAYTFGAAFRFTYKNIDLSVLFQGVSQVNNFYDDRYAFPVYGNFLERHLYSWTEEAVANGDPIKYPRLRSNWNGGSPSEINNTFFNVNTSYIRLKNAELGYFLPQGIANKIGAKRIRIYANGFNLLTWDKLPTKDIDPEVANVGGAIGTHVVPLSRIYNIGFNVVF